MPKFMPDKTPTENLYFGMFNELPECDMEEQDYERLFEILDTLSEREADVIKRRFALKTPHETCAEIGNSFGLSRSRVSQIERKALRKLRHPCRSRHIVNLYRSRADFRSEIAELNERLKEAHNETADVKKELDALTHDYNLLIEKYNLPTGNDAKNGTKPETSNYLELPIEYLDLSVRSYNSLNRAGIKTIHDLTQKMRWEMERIRNLGRKSLEEVEQKLASLGLSFASDEE